MELFGFSTAKIITILIIAVVIFGPAQVAEMVKTVGRTIREVRRYINEMSKEFNEAPGGLREEFAGIAQDLRGELAATQADLRSQLDLTGIFAEATATVTESRATPPVIALGGVGPPLASPIPLGNIGTPTTVGVSRAVIVPADEEAKKAPRWVTQTDLSASLAVLATPGTTTQSIPPRNRTDGVTIATMIGRSVSGSAYLRRGVAGRRVLARERRVAGSTSPR